MLRLRPYKSCDGDKVVSWLSDEKVFHLWGGSLLGEFPISGEILNNTFFRENGFCVESDNFYPMTAFDENGVCGLFIIRYLDGNDRFIRFGWVVVDDKRRGQKLGQRMLTLGLRYAFDILGAERVTIGVFENNTPAYRCYKSVGFRPSESIPDHFDAVDGEKIRVVELELTAEEFDRIRE